MATAMLPSKQTGIAFEDTIMGFDISQTCVGWAALRGNQYETGHLAFGGKFIGDKLYLFRQWLRDAVDMERPAVIANEQPFMGHPAAAAVLYRYHGVFDMVMSKYTGVLYPVHAPTWKSKVCGNGKITTKEKEAGVVLTELSNIGFHVAQIDEGDALCVALCARVEMFGKLKE